MSNNNNSNSAQREHRLVAERRALEEARMAELVAQRRAELELQNRSLQRVEVDVAREQMAQKEQLVQKKVGLIASRRTGQMPSNNNNNAAEEEMLMKEAVFRREAAEKAKEEERDVMRHKEILVRKREALMLRKVQEESKKRDEAAAAAAVAVVPAEKKETDAKSKSSDEENEDEEDNWAGGEEFALKFKDKEAYIGNYKDVDDDTREAFRRVLNDAGEVKATDIEKLVVLECGPTIRGVPPIAIAAYCGNTKYLDNCPAAHFKHKIDSKQRSISEFATRGGHLPVLQWLHQHGHLQVDDKNLSGSSIAHIAVQEGYLDVLQFLVDVAGHKLSVRANDGESLLGIAVRFEHKDIVEWLLANRKRNGGLDVNWRTDVTNADTGIVLGRRAPFAAACMNRGDKALEIVKMLFAAGAHEECLREAKECGGEVKFTRIGSDEVAGKDAARVFARLKHFPVLPGTAIGEERLQKVAVASADKSKSGSTSTSDDQAGGAKNFYFLASGVKRDRFNACLHIAARHDVKIVKFLVEEAGFDIDKDRTVGPFTPLLEAIVENTDGNPDVVEYLVKEQKVDPNKMSSKGMPPVYAASRAGKPGALQHLIDADANLNIIYAHASSFYAAVEQNRLECVEKLLQSGRCDRNTTFYGRTVIQAARERKLEDMLRLLDKFHVV